MKETANNVLEDDLGFQIEGFSEEEKDEIFQQIEKISSQSKISITPELFEVKPAKKGGTLPLAVNLMGILVIAAALFFTNRYFQAKEETMVLSEKTYQSTEDSIVKELKKQAEKKLQQKEQEISKIQSELEKLDKESSNLKATMETQVKAKEAELRKQMEEELAKERARLQGQGISSAELEKQLKEFQTKKEDAINSALNAFKAESEAALKEKEKELAQAKAVARQVLDKANKDKAALEAEAKKREEELTKQFEAEKEALTRQSSEATSKLEQLRELQRNEQLIQDQITGAYTTIMSAIEDGDYPKASLAIEDVRKILADPKIQSLPTIFKRLKIENFILDSLEKEISQTKTEDTTDFKTLAATAQLLINARANVRKGEEAAAAGKSYDAKRYFNAAIASLPKIEGAVNQLREIEAKNMEERARDYIVLGDAALRKGDLSDALEQYRSAAVNSVDTTNKEILSSAIHKIEGVNDLKVKKLSSSETEKYIKLKKDTDRKIAELTDELDNKNSEIDKLNNLIKDEQAKKEELEKKFAEAQANNEQKQTDLLAENEKLNKTIADKDKTIAQLSDEITKSTQRIKNLMRRVNNAEKQVSTLQNELDDAVNQIVDLINQ
ncbi:MAG: hypothetical protein DRP59_03265 [Spirochaetes bacterium]|nr:MAG: hypothetical protein DRP59_03265 [Spirochaetota bacterium]